MSANSRTDPEFNDNVSKPNSGRGSRFIKILGVLAVGTLLVALLLPDIRSVGPSAQRAQCINNLKQIALALYAYESEYQAFPPAYTVNADGRRLHSWRSLILPYLEQKPLYDSIDFTKPWDDPVNARAFATSLNVFRCPAGHEPDNTTTYFAIVAPNGCLNSQVPRRLSEITDPHNSTLMLIEADDENAVFWMVPSDADEALVLKLATSKTLHHSGGTNACFVDGSVQFLRNDVPAQSRRALITISGHDRSDFD